MISCIRSLVALGLVLVACPAIGGSSQSALSYEFQLESTQVRWIRMRDQAETERMCRQLSLTASGRDFDYPSGRIGGCATFDPEARSCTIYALPPVSIEDTHAMAILGHELLHCFTGNFHPYKLR